MKELAIIEATNSLAEIARLADSYAASTDAFESYRSKRSENTLKTQNAALTFFAEYLTKAGYTIDAETLLARPAIWQHMTSGLIQGFIKYMLACSLSIASINLYLSVIKTYCKLATQAGILDTTNYALIALVKGYTQKEGRNTDRQRQEQGIEVRTGSKKAESTTITREQAYQLKNIPGNTEQAIRDRFLMCLLIDHGLRVSEIAGLTKDSVNLAKGTLRFYQEKTDKWLIHSLTRDSLLAAMAYMPLCTGGLLFMGSTNKKADQGKLQGGMSIRAINKRVTTLGKRIGIEALSPHDLRHDFAENALESGSDVKAVQTAMGHSSPAMTLRYVKEQAIANMGIKLANIIAKETGIEDSQVKAC